jgi:hypothetical protein
MTFCSYFEDCVDAEECSRPLYGDIIFVANQQALPLCQFSEKPECHKTQGDLIDEAQYKMEDR